MKTTAGRLRSLSLGARADAEIVFLMPDGTRAEIDTACAELPKPKTRPDGREPLASPNRIVVQLKRCEAATVPA